MRSLQPSQHVQDNHEQIQTSTNTTARMMWKADLVDSHKHAVESPGLACSTRQPGVTDDHEVHYRSVAALTTLPTSRGGSMVRRRGGEHVNIGGKQPPSVSQHALAHVRRAHAHRLLVHDPMQSHSLPMEARRRRDIPSVSVSLKTELGVSFVRTYQSKWWRGKEAGNSSQLLPILLCPRRHEGGRGV